MIYDLSWPPQDSVNDHINLDTFRCFYGSFHDVVALIIKHGVGALSAKLDLADIYKHILITSHDWPLLGSSWDLQWPDGSMTHLYYVDLFLPFGLCSSPVLFNEYADALLYTMKANEVAGPATLPGWLLYCGPVTLPGVCQQHLCHDHYVRGAWLCW